MCDSPVNPQGWSDVVERGLRVLVEEVRLELEMHYDDVASEIRLQKHELCAQTFKSKLRSSGLADVMFDDSKIISYV